MDGYLFFSPYSATKAWIVDNCGRVVNEWDRGTRPGLAAYFLENGKMLRTYKVQLNGPFTSASNAGGLELVDWDNNTVWKYEVNTNEELSHHDAVMMPNGNFLILVWELVYTPEIIEMGRDPDEIASQGYYWSEKIIEVEPTGNEGGTIVWQWEIKDHYVQDFDSTKLNYGVVENHPELFDINLPELNSSNSNSTRDWNHFNALDYNADLDQIVISVRNSDEIWIIDHSTTTAEAKGHTGGHYGKGGDILYRWGNAAAYRQGTTSDQKLFGQHGVHWIKAGLPDAGKILIFNNGNGRPGQDYSTAEILTPPQDSAGFYTKPTAAFGPADSEWEYGQEQDERMYSPYLSNAQRLPNGNTLLNYGSNGRVIEVTSNRDIVWAYEIPVNGDFPMTQGQNPNNNSSFRCYKLPLDYAGFQGIDLMAGSTLENGDNPLGCPSTSSAESLTATTKFEIVHLSGQNKIQIQSRENGFYLSVFSMDGREIRQEYSSGRFLIQNTSSWKSGIYVLKMQNKTGVISQKVFVP